MRSKEQAFIYFFYGTTVNAIAPANQKRFWGIKRANGDRETCTCSMQKRGKTHTDMFCHYRWEAVVSSLHALNTFAVGAHLETV